MFRGVVAHVNGYTQPSLSDLHKLIVSYGGGFMQYLDGKTTVTHIIASALTPKKAVEFRRYRIVKPAWVVESVKAGRLLPWDAFRVLDEGAGQKVLGFDGGKFTSQANMQDRGYKEQSEGSWYASRLKKGDAIPHGSNRTAFLKLQPPTPEGEDEINDAPSPLLYESVPPELEDELALLEEWPLSSYGSTSRREQEETALGTLTPPVTSPIQHANEEETTTEPGAPAALPDLRPDRWDESGSHKRSRSEQDDGQSKRARMTAEEHNAMLLADPRIRKSTVVNPDFLEQYYRESRLHHLSTWKANLKSQLQAMAAEKSLSQLPKHKRTPGARRYILHVDFDSFFAAVSLKKYPQFKDKPAVVAHGGGSGSEIASCNYPARKYGIKNGMWMKRAQQLCPELKVLPYDFPAYEEASRAFYDAVLATQGIVQSVSIDEALIDVSAICLAVGGSDGRKISEGSTYREQAKADEIAQQLREEVKRRTGCDVSVGIGGNILLAKVALREAKPAGQYQIKPEKILDFIGNLEVQDLPGVASSIGGKLEEIGIKYVRDIRGFSRERLINTLGPKTGERIWEYARGVDRMEVGDQVVRKSVSAEVNWGVRFETQEQVDEFIESLCGELHKRLVNEGVRGRQFTMKIMRRAPDAPLDPPKHLGHGKCDTYNKSVVLGVATNAQDVLSKESLSILKGFGFTPGELRGIGVQMTKLEPLRVTAGGQAESSQRRLQFKIGHPVKLPEKPVEDPIQDYPETPKKLKAQPGQVAFGSEQLNSSSPSRKPLNILGTQFILPSQVDLNVLAELPEDIRARLAKHVQPAQRPPSHAPLSHNKSAAQVSDPIIAAPPNQSQLDQEILDALPPDIRNEVLAFYSKSLKHPQTSPKRRHEQTLLPQSPRKNRILPVPPVRKRGRPRLFPHVNLGGNATLTQSNFTIARPSPALTSAPTTDTEAEENTDTSEPAEISPEFLAALPEDIRREVLEEHRRARLGRRAGPDAQTSRKKSRPARQPQHTSDQQDGQGEEQAQRFLQLPPRPARPTFTTKKLHALADLREAVKAWVQEFGDEGPYKEDVEALAAYLERVVRDERDMAKAVGVVRWMAWVLDQGGGYGGAGDGSRDDAVVRDGARRKWEEALERVRSCVQEAVKARGLGTVKF